MTTEAAENEVRSDPEATQVADEDAPAPDGALFDAAAFAAPAPDEPVEMTVPDEPAVEVPEETPTAESPAAASAPDDAEPIEAVPVEEPDGAPVPAVVEVPWWPFAVYGALWLAFSVGIVVLLRDTPDGQAVYEARIYLSLLFVGMGLVALAPVVSIAVWAVVRARSGGGRQSIFVASLLRGAVVAAIGALMWWTALSAVDYLRLGGLF